MINEKMITHLLELRKRVIYIFLGFVIVFLSLFHFANQIYLHVSAPLLKLSPADKLIATDITSPFFIPVKLTAIIAIFLSLPNTFYQSWKFIAPALFAREKRLTITLAISSLILFLCGILFCFYLVLPIIIHFITTFKSTQINMFTDIGKYLDFILNLFLIFGIAFQTPIIIFVLIKFAIIDIKQMQKLRSYMFVGAFIVGAILAPPDILSQTLLAIPLYLLYEIGLLAAKLLIAD